MERYLKVPNRNYEKGRRKEYKVCKELREAGFDIVQRSAGSHSPIDIFAIDKKARVIHLVQCKPDNYSKKKQFEILNEHSDLNEGYEVIFYLR